LLRDGRPHRVFDILILPRSKRIGHRPDSMQVSFEAIELLKNMLYLQPQCTTYLGNTRRHFGVKGEINPSVLLDLRIFPFKTPQHQSAQETQRVLTIRNPCPVCGHRCSGDANACRIISSIGILPLGNRGLHNM
jgi:hypothetical protein